MPRTTQTNTVRTIPKHPTRQRLTTGLCGTGMGQARTDVPVRGAGQGTPAPKMSWWIAGLGASLRVDGQTCEIEQNLVYPGRPP
jgi:hypothetical protein